MGADGKGWRSLMAWSLGLSALLVLGCHHLRPRGEAEWSDAPAPPAAGAGHWGYAGGVQPWSQPNRPYAGPAPAAQPGSTGPWGTPGSAPGPSPAPWPSSGSSGAGAAGAAGEAPRAPAPAGPYYAPSHGHAELLAARAVAFARWQLGKPYCWGGTGPQCFDCSGLTYAAWRWAGKPVPRMSSSQREKLGPIPWVVARPGDIAWRPGHVGLYVGDGWVIHAPETGKRVEYEPARKYEQALRP